MKAASSLASVTTMYISLDLNIELNTELRKVTEAAPDEKQWCKQVADL